MEITKKVIVGLGITAGVAASVSAIYLLLKEESIEKNYFEGTRSQRQAIIRVRVPAQLIGPIIGRGGENIKRIQLRTKTRMNFEDRNNENAKMSNDPSDFRYVVIRGSPENILEAEEEINNIIKNQPLTLTEEIFIPAKAVGCIIGKQGSSIKSLCDASGAKMTVASQAESRNDGLHKITIKGTSSDISTAKELINDKLLENERRNLRSQHALRYKNRTLEIESNGSFSDSSLEYPTEKLVSTSGDGTVKVFVSNVRSPSKFWVQVVDTNGILLDKLSGQMTDFYELTENRISTKVKDISVGQIVAAPYKNDDNWYRSKIIKYLQGYSDDDTKVLVYYLDFGDEYEVFKTNLCILKEEFLDALPFQAIECCLAGVKPIDSNGWTDESVEYFREITYASNWKEVCAKPLSTNDKNSTKSGIQVELIDILKEKDVNIGEALIENGFAFKENHV